MNRILLFLFMLPKALYSKMGADLPHLKAILKVRMLMDDRKPLAWNQQSNANSKKNKGKTRGFKSIMAFVISLFIGLFYTMPLYVLKNEAVGITFYFTAMLALLAFSMITDFANVLIDPRDKYILLPKPVNGETIFLSKLIHTGIFLVRLVLPLSVGGWLYFGFAYGWRVAVLFPLPLILLTLTALFVVLGLYLLLIRLAGKGQFQNWLNGFQIGFSILILATFYLGPQLLREEAVQSLTINSIAALKALPSYWIGTIIGWVKPSFFPRYDVWYSVAAIVFPIVFLWAIVRFLAPLFVARLADLEVQETTSQPQALEGSGKIIPAKKSLATTLALKLNTHKAAQAGFMMAWWQSGRSRTFKMRVLPSLAYVPLYFVYILTTMGDDLSISQAWQQLGTTKSYLFLLYITAFALMQALNYIVLSDQYKAAWVYHAAPLQQPGYVMAGALKAAWVKYFLPFFLIIGAFVLVKWGTYVWLDVLLAFVNVSFFSVCMAYITYRTFPFSQMEARNRSGGRVFRSLFAMAIPGAMGFGHYLAADLWWLKIIYLLLSLALLWMAWDSFRNTSWKTIIASNQDDF